MWGRQSCLQPAPKEARTERASLGVEIGSPICLLSSRLPYFDLTAFFNLSSCLLAVLAQVLEESSFR